MEELRIIRTDSDRIAELAALEAECFSTPLTESHLWAMFGAGDHIFLIALLGDRVAGYVGLQTVLDEGYIVNVAVRPDFRRRGIARALMQALEAQAAEMKLSFLTLEVRESNLGAIRLYESCGYVPVGLRKNYYEAPTENALLMTKYL